MKILNAYAGIGGNRKLWGDDDKIVAVEHDERIAAIYADLWPNDTVIVADAHQYILDHHQDFDFIWASPPCPSHSQTNTYLYHQGIRRYPDMRLYQEIIFLSHFHQGKYVVENVKSYYEPLIKPQVSGRHYFWANFRIPALKKGIRVGRFGPLKKGQPRSDNPYELEEKLGFDLSRYSGINREKTLRNCVTPEIGLAIFQAAKGIYQANRHKTGELF